MHIREIATGKVVNFYDIASDKDIKATMGERGDTLETLAYTDDGDLILLGSLGHWYAPPWGKYVVEV